MVRLLSFIKKMMFWGTLSLASIIWGLNVSLASLKQDVFSNIIPIKSLAIFMVISVPIFILLCVLDLVRAHKDRIGVFNQIFIVLPTLASVPYLGFSIFKTVKHKKYPGYNYDFKIYISRVFEMIIWWAILIYSIIMIKQHPNCAVSISISDMADNELLIRFGIILTAIIALNLIGWIGFAIQCKIVKNYATKETNMNYGSNKAFYTKNIPSGCNACGGPYPSCKSSCNLYEND